MSNLLNAWKNVQPDIKTKIGDHSYETWFAHIHAEVKEPDQILLITPDEFFKNWVVDNYLEIIRSSLKEHCTNDITISVIMEKRGEALPISSGQSEGTHSTIAPIINRSEPVTSAPNRQQSANVQSRFTFDNFVVGNSNRMAYAASRSVADNPPGRSYNPLFIYGQSGLGKTHLMQSIANSILKTKSGLTCLYLSSEQFMNELISAIQHRSPNNFRLKYRNVDVLLIDDIQFIAGRESTQEEFFHTFNALHNNHKQIIISSDRPPKEIPDLEDRLVTRFQWGLTTDIQPPDFETRVAILRKKNEQDKVNVPDEVIFYIAENIKSNIRELEGALIRVVACSLLEDKKVNLDMTQNILQDMIRCGKKTISIEMIQIAVAEHFKITISDLCSPKRKQTIALPRQIAMYLTRKLTPYSLPEVGKAFGGRDHTTVLHSCKKIEENINISSEIKYSVEKLSLTLNH